MTSRHSAVPAGCGAGMRTRVAELKFGELITVVEYLRSYSEAVPVVPSSPGAVHDTALPKVPVADTSRSVTAAGGVTSLGGGTHWAVAFPWHVVAACGRLLIAD